MNSVEERLSKMSLNDKKKMGLIPPIDYLVKKEGAPDSTMKEIRMKEKQKVNVNKIFVFSKKKK